jgi:MYXO-CTERM domain-containing protein
MGGGKKKSSGGCSISAAGGSSPGLGAWLALLGAAALVLRRRRA